MVTEVVKSDVDWKDSSLLILLVGITALAAIFVQHIEAIWQFKALFFLVAVLGVMKQYEVIELRKQLEAQYE